MSEPISEPFNNEISPDSSSHPRSEVGSHGDDGDHFFIKLMNGWIKLHRRIEKHWLWPHDEPYSRSEAWEDLLMAANHKENSILFRDELIHIKRGEFVTSIRKLSDKWTWSRKRVSRFLKRLEKEEMVTQKRSQRYTRINITNYSRYQDVVNGRVSTEIPTDDPTRVSTEISTGASQTRNNKKDEERKRKGNGESKVPPTPTQRLIDIYHEHCKTLPRVIKIPLSNTSQKHLKQRWREHPEENWWEKYFKHVNESPFLTGDNDRSWTADFHWLILPANMEKVINGRYKTRNGWESV